MTLDQMKENDRVFTTEGTGVSHLSANAVNNIKQWLIDKIKDDITDGTKKTAAENHLQNIEIVWLNSREIDHKIGENVDLNLVNSSYFGNVARNRTPDEVKLTEWFIISLDIN